MFSDNVGISVHQKFILSLKAKMLKQNIDSFFSFITKFLQNSNPRHSGTFLIAEISLKFNVDSLGLQILP